MDACTESSAFALPSVPVPHHDFLSYVNHKDANEVSKLVGPFNEYEARLREGFAQHRGHPTLQDPNVNAVPIFNNRGDIPCISDKVVDEKTHHQDYIIPLSPKNRKPAGAPATVESIQDFRKNFNLFSESSLADLDWSNVVAAGSSVVTPLLPVPDKYSTSKKAQREYYHQQLAPSSDVDLFIWGLDEAAAVEKMKQIEASVRNAILEEVTSVRTRNAITIASHYPIRHVQIVLRLYKSVSEILSGFDVDCSCFAYDGSQVYGTPRGIVALMTQTNTIDLTRRSPSYESRLSKYAHRGFEVYWPDLDRSKVDPTIFERSFARTTGLARLLVLEQLPKPGDREDYLIQRREERCRPPLDTYYRSRRSLPDNVKERDPDDIAEWVYDDAASNYHSFTVPYGPKYHAKKIEKLLYTKDLLLNAEWNQNKDRTVNLHRHPCFIGPLESVLHDCCGFCPEPKSDDEREVAEEESKIYVSGDVQFMKDDPGRQAIGSFNPLTNDDWTEMAYIGNTQELCQKICEGDVGFVDDWCKANHEGVDRRDHAGRTPLHLAAQCSTPEVVKSLVDNGARIVSRLVDGMTALHIAAARGNVDMVITLLEKSESNEAEEADKEDRKRAEKEASSQSANKRSDNDAAMKDDDEDSDDDSDEDMEDVSSEDDTAMTEGSFVKVADQKRSDEDALDGDDKAKPDFYDVNVLAWDTPVSPLHLAILGGHTEVIKTLISAFGADALLPIKIIDQYSRSPSHAIMTLVIAARLSDPSSYRVVHDLLAHGASSAQVDLHRVSAFHYLVARKKVDLLKACIEEDGAAAKGALNHIVVDPQYWRPQAHSPLTTAIRTGDTMLVNYLLDVGAKAVIDLDSFVAAYTATEEDRPYYIRDRDISELWRDGIAQPIFLAVENDMPDVAMRLLDKGADINTIDGDAYRSVKNFKANDKHHLHGNSVLDTIISKIEALDRAIDKKIELPRPPILQKDSTYLEGKKTGSYAHWYTSKSIEATMNIIAGWKKCISKKVKDEEDRPGKQARLEALKALKARFQDLQYQLKDGGAKTLEELHPNMSRRKDDEEDSSASEDVPIQLAVRFRVSASDEVLEGYSQLFEAAWEGKNDKIKTLTLAKWGPGGDRKPLHVATQDEKGFTIFVIATFRGHFETARLILSIADAQFKGWDNTKVQRRYEIAGTMNDDSEGEEDEEDDSSADGNSDNLDISSRVIDDTYTYDNIAELQDAVDSKVSAAELLRKSAELWWFLDKPEKEARDAIGATEVDVGRMLASGRSTLDVMQNLLSFARYDSCSIGRFAMASRDMGLLRFWLQCCQEASKMKRKDEFDADRFAAQDYPFAIHRGYVEEMAEIIKTCGAQLPLDALIKNTGMEEAKKPMYYQGLSIGGKKMTGWARERGGEGYRSAIDESSPPLLQAANAGSLAAVEWFLSDTPLRLYKEYQENHKDDARLRKLAEAPGGFQSLVGQWLKQRNQLTLHGAVLSNTDQKESLKVVDYLIAVMPDSIDMPSARDQLTPLALAFLQGRVDAAQSLIEAGADQTIRESNGKNLVHLALVHASKSLPADMDKFRNLLDLIDKRLIRSLLTERCKDAQGGLTPPALWLSKTGRYGSVYEIQQRLDRAPEIVTILCEFGGEEALTMMDGSGQFPLHLAVKASHAATVKLMLERDPALLFRENAMGQTPLELAHSLYVRHCAEARPDIRKSYKAFETREPEEFVEKDKGEADADSVDDATRTWEVCKRFADEEPRGRHLVSVNEAREVAKRLADRKKKESDEKAEKEEEKEKEAGAEGEGGKKKKVKDDEVSRWLGYDALKMG